MDGISELVLNERIKTAGKDTFCQNELQPDSCALPLENGTATGSGIIAFATALNLANIEMNSAQDCCMDSANDQLCAVPHASIFMTSSPSKTGDSPAI
jgi:hypothetical protein